MRKRVPAQCNKANHENSCDVLIKVDIQSGKVLAFNMARLELYKWMVKEKESLLRKKPRKTG